jgi:hypothetical protein
VWASPQIARASVVTEEALRLAQGERRVGLVAMDKRMRKIARECAIKCVTSYIWLPEIK